ncbi:MAG: hypothetical protein H3Z52_15565 [archaeon]|nr:hypothetical protein [archaeon]MCP8322335.1 hypothetical protein [archaeon]
MAKKNDVNHTVNWQTIGDWIDTEGTIKAYGYTDKKRFRVCQLAIYQKEREPLDKLNDFLRHQGTNCSVTFLEEAREHQLQCGKKEDAKKIVKNTETYYITTKKKKQVKRFKELCED